MSTLDLPPSTDSVPVARRFVRAELAQSSLDVDTAVLLVSELVTNAVLHGRSPFTLTLEHRDEVVRVEVVDGSPLPPRVHSFSALSATGRGLRLVERLAVAWGVDPRDGGKSVWFEVGSPTDDAWESFLVDEELLAPDVSRDR